MKSKLYLIIFLAVASGMPMPAQASIWSSLRNSALITAIWGNPTQVNHTAQTRLPVVEVKPSIFARMFNFFSWMNFTRPAQPAPAPAPQPAVQPAAVQEQPLSATLSPLAAARFTNQFERLRNEYVQAQSILSPEAAQNLADRLDAMHKEHEAKKLAELEALEENDRITANIREKADSLKLDLEKARSEAEHNKKGWTALSNHAREQDKLIESKQQELDTLSQQQKTAESEKEAATQTIAKHNEELAVLKAQQTSDAQRIQQELNVILQQKKTAETEAQKLKETAAQTTAKYNNELALLKTQLASLEGFSSSLNKEQLAKVQAEKDSLISQNNRLHKENTEYLHQKNSIAALLREKQLAAETAEQKAKDEIKRLNEHMAQLKSEFQSECTLRSESQEELRRVTSAYTRLKAEFTTTAFDRDSQLQAAATERAYKESISHQLRLLESKSASELRELQHKLDAEQKAHDQAKKELESSKQQESAARNQILSLNGILNTKDAEAKALQNAHNQETAEIHKLLQQKRSDIDLLMKKFEYEEKQKKQTKEHEEEQNKKIIATVNNFEHQTTEALNRLEEAGNQRLNALNSRLARLHNRFGQKLTSNNTPELPVLIVPTEQQKIDERMTQFELNLTQFELQRKAALASTHDEIPAGLLQSNIPSNAQQTSSPNAELNTSITGQIVESFAYLSKNPSHELPVELVDEKRTSPGIEDTVQIDPVTYDHLVKLGETYLAYIDTDQIQDFRKQSEDLIYKYF